MSLLISTLNLNQFYRGLSTALLHGSSWGAVGKTHTGFLPPAVQRFLSLWVCIRSIRSKGILLLNYQWPYPYLNGFCMFHVTMYYKFWIQSEWQKYFDDKFGEQCLLKLKKNKILNFKFNHNMDGKNPIFINICMPCRALFYQTVHFLFIIMKWNSLDHQSKPWQKSLILVKDFLPPEDMLQSNTFFFTTPNYYDPICLSCWYQNLHFSLIFLSTAPDERAKKLKHNPSRWRHQTHKRAHN